jgi:hypothetical protein
MAKKQKMPKEQLNDATTDALEVTTGTKDATAPVNQVPSAKGADAVEASQIKDEVAPKAVFNTKKAAELVSDGSIPSSGMGLTLTRSAAIPFGGGAGQIAKDKSATVKGVGPIKSGDRPGRTIDTALRHLDDIPAETFRVPLTTIPQLREGTSGVGYNGNYENEHAITQKGSGGSPASNKFFRTLDLIEYDNLYWVEGQMNLPEREELSIHNWNGNAYDVNPKKFNIGNYLVRKLEVTIDGSNNVTKLNFDVDDLTRKKYDDTTDAFVPDYLSEDEARAAGDAVLRQRNIAELDRLKMAQEAGDESKEGWSSLGVVIHDPTPTNRAYKEVDAMAGDFVYVSANKLASALSMQLNKAAKDGMRKVSPIFEMNEGNIENNNVRHASYPKESIAGVFSATAMKDGSAALFIAINDSTAKYNTKSKFLSLPLSYKMAIDTVKKNNGSLMMHKTLFDEYNRQEVFGKIDADGSGMTPYFLSDGAGLIMPINIADTFNNNATIVDNKIEKAFNIHYEDVRNKYDYDCYNFFVQGLLDWFVRKANNIRKVCLSDADYKNNQPVTITIPVTSTTSCLSLWDLIVCDACKDIAVERQYAMEPVLKYEMNHGYPYSGLTSLGSINLFGTSGIGFTDIAEPLRSSPVPLNVAVRLLMPEVFTAKSVENFDLAALYGGNMSAAQVVVPWYFNQTQFEPRTLSNGKAWEFKAGDNAFMTFFDTRGGVTFGNMDRVLALDPEQLKLDMDRMINLPAIHKVVDQNNYNPKAYKYSNGDDGLVVNNYYVFCADNITNKLRGKMLLIHDILSTPRELGLSMIAPAGIVTPAYDGSHANYRDVDSSYFYVSGPSFRLKYWHVATTISNTIFQDNLITGQGTNFSAKYDVIEATPDRGSDDIGIYLYANKATGGSAYVVEDIIPFKVVTDDGHYDYNTATYVAGEATDSGSKALKLNSILKYLYTRVQLLPFIINPFDACCYKFSGKPSFTLINKLDDFDFLHLYNVCGFRAGEYSGLQYDRNRARINLGLGYVSDPYIERRL